MTTTTKRLQRQLRNRWLKHSRSQLTAGKKTLLQAPPGLHLGPPLLKKMQKNRLSLQPLTTIMMWLLLYATSMLRKRETLRVSHGSHRAWRTSL